MNLRKIRTSILDFKKVIKKTKQNKRSLVDIMFRWFNTANAGFGHGLIRERIIPVFWLARQQLEYWL
jgi:hypothetical protein